MSFCFYSQIAMNGRSMIASASAHKLSIISAAVFMVHSFILQMGKRIRVSIFRIAFRATLFTPTKAEELNFVPF